jgi:GNAT superfamily N-acetyltransferase
VSPAELRRRMEATLDRYHLLGTRPILDPLARFSLDPDRPDVWDANQVRAPRAASPDEIDHLLERIEELYGGLSHRRVVIDLDASDALEARLALDGWQLDTTLQHLLTGPTPTPPSRTDLTISAVQDEADWAELERLTRLDHIEEAAKATRDPWPGELTRAMVGHRRLKAPEMQPWLAWSDGTAVGMFSSMPGDNGIGLVEDLFVEAEARGRGIAQALIAHATADARDRGATSVIIGSLPDDWPKLLYARLGFRPVFVERAWDLDRPSAQV